MSIAEHVSAPSESVTAASKAPSGDKEKGKEKEAAAKAKRIARAEVVADRFKTKLCTKWLETGRCPYDARCMFAHGENELRTTAMNVRDGLTTEESIWRFKKTGILGVGPGGGVHRSMSHDAGDHRHAATNHPTATPTPTAMHIVGHPFQGQPAVFHMPHMAMPSLMPVAPHYMPYLAPHPTAAHHVHPAHVGPMLSFFPPAHPFAYSSAPPSPMVYLVDPSGAQTTFSGMLAASSRAGGGSATANPTTPQ